jgi:hypothetical protein
MSNPNDPLRGPKLKVERAKRHLADLKAAMESFFATKPHEMISEKDSKTGEEIFRIRIHKCIPSDISIITGDVIHNLRSGLDQLICALVIANRRQITRGNGFPIAGSLEKFERAAVAKLKNLSVKADGFIRSLKPYNGADSTFWQLNELDILDKHNAIIPVAVGQVQIGLQLGMPGLFRSPDQTQMYVGGGPTDAIPLGFEQGFFTPSDAKPIPFLHDNCEVYRMGAKIARFPHNVELVGKIAFGKTEATNYEPIFDTLESFSKLVESTIDIVERKVI